MFFKKFLTTLYVYRFVSQFLVILPLFTVMMQDYGLSTLQISILLVAWSASSFVLEIPTGIVADLYSRRMILAVSSFVQAACYLCWLLYPTFEGFLAGFFLWGLADALHSGTFEALIYDEMKGIGKEASYQKVMAILGGLYFAGSMLAALAASFLVSYGYTLLLNISIGVSVITGLMPLLFPETKKARGVEHGYLSLGLHGLTHLWNQKTLWFLAGLIIVTSILSMGLMEFWALIANDAGVPHTGLGIFLGVVFTAQALASLAAHRYAPSKRVLLLFFVLGGVLLEILGLVLSIPTLLLAVVFIGLYTYLGTVFNAQLQHAIPSETRATITSAISFVGQIGKFALFLVFGAIVSLYSYGMALEVFGVLTIAVGGIYICFLPRHR